MRGGDVDTLVLALLVYDFSLGAFHAPPLRFESQYAAIGQKACARLQSPWDQGHGHRLFGARGEAGDPLPRRAAVETRSLKRHDLPVHGTTGAVEDRGRRARLPVGR
jgi:hypothetical protein